MSNRPKIFYLIYIILKGLVSLRLHLLLFLSSGNLMLNNAVIGAGEAYEEIARITDEQAKKDWEPLGDMMHDYKGLLAGWPNVLSIHSVS